MKLYYSAGSCSTSCHITLEESGLAYEAVEIDWDDPAQAAEAQRLNPLGTLPVFLTDENKMLDQNAAIHTYVADKVPAKKLLPPAGTVERAEAMNWLAFVTSDLHKSFSPLFAVEAVSGDKAVQEAVRAWAKASVKGYLSYMDQKLEGRDYLTGKDFTVADAYAFVVVNWTQWVGIPLDGFDRLKAYLKRVHDRPAVRKVFEIEGL